MLGVHGDTVVLGLASAADVLPAALLLLQVEAGGVWEEEEGEEHAGQAEPRHDVELRLCVDVVVEDGGEEGTKLADGGGDTVGGRANGRGEDLGGDEEGNGVGSELVEERRQKVHGLEGTNTLDRGVVLVVERRNNKQDEVHEETQLHHVLATEELVVDEEGGEVVSAEGDDDVDQVPGPAGHDGGAFGGEDLDELRLEQLVAVEEDVVAEPRAGGGDQATAKVGEGQAERLGVVAGDVDLLLGHVQLLAGKRHLVGTVVDEPERAEGGESEGDAEGPLRHVDRVRRVAAVVEDEHEDDENDLIPELTPALHEEGHGDLATTVETILLGGHSAGPGGVLHGGGGRHRVLTTNTNTVEEERNSVADDPALEVETPRGSEHEQTAKHDQRILDETPSATKPVRVSAVKVPSMEREETTHQSPSTPTRT